MSYAAEPYAQFVQDIVLALTGGVTRQEFQFLPENMPFRLSAPGPIVPLSVEVFGQANGAYRRFLARTDYTLLNDFTIQWNARADGTPAADAVWPDTGTSFYANFEYRAPGGAVPQLTDRNPGSVVRLLGESFAREFAVLSRQLESVYRAGFLDTAGSRDLDQLAALVGITRKRATFAAGTVVFGRSTPSPADIFIPSGTRVSTSQPPPVIFETTQDQTLRRGHLSVEVPIQAVSSGAAGILPAGTIQVIHRPILGVENVNNTQPTQFAATGEDDDALRARARRTLETAGQATTGALLGALTSIPGLREKDVRITEDPLAHPGVVKLNVALPAISDSALHLATVQQALELIEETRPVGVRILTNIDAPRLPGAEAPGSGLPPPAATDLFLPVNVVVHVKPTLPPLTAQERMELVDKCKNAVNKFLVGAGLGEILAPAGGPPVAVGPSAGATDLFLPVNVVVHVAPAALSLTAQERTELEHKCQNTVNAFLADAGLGEILIYNRLVARLMALDQVLDVAVELYPQAHPEQPHDKNLVPANPNVRPVAGLIDVQLGGSLVMLDVSVIVMLTGTGLQGDPKVAYSVALGQIADQLKHGLEVNPPSTLSRAALEGLLTTSDTYSVQLHYSVEYQDAGVRVHQRDLELPLSGTEQLWIRNVSLENDA